MIGNHVPSVDVFVVCCGEPEDVILDTVKAACKIDWPTHRLRVIVADDGNSASLQKEVEQLRLQLKWNHLHYYSRVKPSQGHGYKAGNLNATLVDYVAKLPAGYSEYFAVFDADMMPEANILRALIPYALEDQQVAMVTAAQVGTILTSEISGRLIATQFHYNVPTNDPLNQGNTTGTGADDGLRDRVNAAWCPGSGFIMRTTAWKDIDKFPEFSITEDLITSWFLHGRGWKIVLVPGVMQWGLQPDCLLTHLKQRRRWVSPLYVLVSARQY
jgi:cellulose synthase/poly-beta-1,6-N-acetylglucosamine synthase-like glycosyltransferase